MCVCVWVCVCGRARARARERESSGMFSVVSTKLLPLTFSRTFVKRGFPNLSLLGVVSPEYGAVDECRSHTINSMVNMLSG